jgi:hypothetical protein
MTKVGARRRAKQIVQRYADGATLEEVGREFKLTRERIRQIIVLSGNNVGELRKQAQKRRRRSLLRRSRPLIEEKLSEGHTPREVARALRLPLDIVSRVDRANPEFSRTRRTRRRLAPSPKYSNEEVLECLRQANNLVGGVLSTSAYSRVARERHFADCRPWPTNQTSILRFGSWRSALREAGLAHNPSTPITGKRLFEPSHCIDAILEAERALGHLPTVREYEQFSRAMGGALPSAATVRHRLGRWPDALREATEFLRRAEST